MKEELENLIKQCGNRFRKLTLHSENPKHPEMIWQATPNQYTSKYKRGARGRTPCEAVKNLLEELNKKMKIHIKNEIIRIIGKLDNGSHSSNQLQGIDETLTSLFYEHLKELKNEIIKKSTFEGGVSSNGWYQIYKDDLDSII